MPIQRTLPNHDPTSPECLVAKSQLEMLDKQEKSLDSAKKSLEFSNICALVGLICTLVTTIAIVIASVAICSWTATHHDNFYYLEATDYGTVRMVER